MADKKYIGEPGKQDDPCWKGYEMVGMKKKGGRKVPNCVPEAREIIEKAKAKSKKDPLTGAKIDSQRFILPEEAELEEGEEKGGGYDGMPKGLQDRAPRGRARNAMGRAIARQERNLARARMDRAARKMEEEAEQVDEVSKNLMLRYVSANKKSDKTAQEKGDYSKSDRRMRGTDVAVRKYTATNNKYVRVPATEETKPDYSEAGDAERIRKRQEGDQKTRDAEKAFEKRAKSIKHAAEFLQRYKASKGVKEEVELEETEGKVYSVHVKGDSEQHNSPEFKKHLAGWGGEKHYTSDKGAAYKFKKEYQATGFHHGVRSMFKKLDSEHDGLVKEEIEQINESGYDQNAHSVSVGYTPKTPPKTKPIAKPTMHPAAEKPRTPQSSVGSLSRIRGAMAKRVNNSTVKEELGKSNEWGRPELRKKYAAMTPGQESMAADKIPSFDPRYDDVTTQYCGGIKEGYLAEISAKGAEARAKFQAKVRQTLADPKNIARAKKTLAKKKEIEKAKEPAHLVMQLRKAVSVGSKVHFQDGQHHAISGNHADIFMSKYNSAKSSIEKEALQKRAHKSHAEFMRTIAEDHSPYCEPMDNMGTHHVDSYEAHRGSGDQISPVISHDDEDIRFQDFDEAAFEKELEADVLALSWDDLVDLYDEDEIEYDESPEEEGEDLEEGITPAGRLKKKFNAMRSKSRRTMARNIAIKRVSSPEKLKSRSVRAARRMVYKRLLRNRDISSVSSSEKTRLEAQIKRMAPMVARLSVRVMPAVRKLEQSRIKNNRTRKKK